MGVPNSHRSAWSTATPGHGAPIPPSAQSLATLELWCPAADSLLPPAHSILRAGSPVPRCTLQCPMLCTSAGGLGAIAARSPGTPGWSLSFPPEESSVPCSVWSCLSNAWSPGTLLCPSQLQKRGPMARGNTSTPLHPALGLASFLVLNYFLLFCPSSPPVNPWNRIFVC